MEVSMHRDGKAVRTGAAAVSPGAVLAVQCYREFARVNSSDLAALIFCNARITAITLGL